MRERRKGNGGNFQGDWGSVLRKFLDLTVQPSKADLEAEMLVHSWNAITQEAKAGGSPVQAQPGLNSELLSQKKEKQKSRGPWHRADTWEHRDKWDLGAWREIHKESTQS